MAFQIITRITKNLVQDLADVGAIRCFVFLHTYINEGILVWKELGKVEIGQENTCSIRVLDLRYVFSLSKISDTLHRSSTTSSGVGYKLFPYFGGNEVAPHDIHIKIKEL